MSFPVNQRIESYWSKFVVDRPGWCKLFFQDMVDLEIFDPRELTLLDCIRFCYISILRKELTDIANEWNPHLLSPNINNTPSGRPDIMYFLLHLYRTTDHMISINLSKPTNLLLLPPALYPLTCLMSLVSLQRHWWMNNNMEMSHDASIAYLACNYTFWVKSRNKVRLP